MADATWVNMLGLFVGMGLIFMTNFETLRDHSLKALGCVMIVVSVVRLLS